MVRSWAPVFLILLAGCAHRAAPPVAVAPLPAPPPAIAIVPMPAGASPGMTIPAVLTDGSYPTPSRGLSPAAAVWHLRVALNVAALACRGAARDAIVTRYNALLASQRAVFATAQAAVAQEFATSGKAGAQGAYDDAMTRLYNWYALAPAREGFCAAADRVLANASAAPIAGYASAALAELDRPFTDFYRAYDAWRYQRPAVATAMIAAAAPARPAATATRAPRLEVDPAIFRQP